MNQSIQPTFGRQKIIGIAADHGGYELKEYLAGLLLQRGFEVCDFGDFQFEASDDYPDFVIPLARAVSLGNVASRFAVVALALRLWRTKLLACVPA